MSRRATRRDREHAYQGQGQGQAGTPSLSLFEQVLALSAGRPFFTTSNVAEVGGKIAAWFDWNDPSHLLSQASGALQATYRASDVGFGGKPSAGFAAARYQSSRPPSAWRFLHDGVGCDVYTVLRGTGPGTVRAIWSTLTNYPTPGTHLAHSAVSSWQTTMSGVAGCIVAAPFGPVVSGEATFLRAHYAPLPWEMAKKSAVGSSGSSYASAPSSADPDHTLWVGDIGPGGGYAFAGDVVAIGFFPALAAEQRAVVEQWIAAEYTYTTEQLFEQVLALSAGRPVFTADNYIEVSGKVVGFVDWNDPTHVLMQASSAAQVAVPLPHADFAGALCASFTGAQNYVSNRPTSQWVTEHDGVSSEVFFVLSPTASGIAFFMATAANASAAGFHLYDDGTYRHFLSNDSGGAVINTAPAGTPSVGVATYVDIRHRAADAAQYVIRHRGTLTAQDPYTAPPSPGPASIPCELGARNGALFSSMRWPALGFFPALDDAQRAIVQQWILQAYGIAA